MQPSRLLRAAPDVVPSLWALTTVVFALSDLIKLRSHSYVYDRSDANALMLCAVTCALYNCDYQMPREKNGYSV